MNDESVLLVDWLVADGTEVEAGQPVALIETSKTAVEVEAPVGGFLRHGIERGTEVAVGAVFCHIGSQPASAAADSVVEQVVAVPPSSAPVLASPAVVIASSPAGAVPDSQSTRFSAKALELMKQHRLSSDIFKDQAFVREADVARAVENRRLPAALPDGPAVLPVVPQPQAPNSGGDSGPVAAVGVPLRTEDLPRSKRVEARYLSSGRQHTLQSVVSVLCPAAGLKAAAAMQPKLGGNTAAVVIYETARLLRKYPVLNAFHDRGTVNYYQDVNVGFAVDGGRGLKVPVIAHADRKGLVEIAEEVEGFLLDYLNDQLATATLAGGTFTITDLSGEDVVSFHPLINQGQAAILGIGAEQQLTSGATLQLFLSFDHQLAEGRLAARFLRELRDRIVTYELAARFDETDETGAACSACRRVARELGDDAPLLEGIGTDGGKTWICKGCLWAARIPR